VLNITFKIQDLPFIQAHSELLLPIHLVPSFEASNYRSRAFPVAAAKICNALPDSVISASSIDLFWYQLQ